MRLGSVFMLVLVLWVTLQEEVTICAAALSNRFANSSAQDPFPSDDSSLPIPCEENEVEGKAMGNPVKSFDLFTLSLNIVPIQGTILREHTPPCFGSCREMLNTLHILLI